MSCYQTLSYNIRDMDHRQRSIISICNVLLTLFGFFILFYWFSQWQKSHADSLTLEPTTIAPPVWYKNAPYDPYKAGNLKKIEEENNEIREEYTTKKPKNITAATLFPAKTTTTFDPIILDSETSENSESKTPCSKRIVGYYNGWANRKLTKNQMRKVSHLIFAFVKINENGEIFFENDEKKSLFLEMKKKAKEVNPNVKVMISIGGMWNSEHFGKIVSNFKRRSHLVTSITNFLQTHQFDGVDIFWKWPKIQDKANYVFLLRELRKSLQNSQNPGLISIVAPSIGFDGFHLRGISKYIDFLNVETDRQASGPYTSAPAPLFSKIGEYQEYNIDWTMRHLSCITGSPQKLNIGVPFYGRFWKGVQGSVEKADGMWRTVEPSSSGKISSGTVFWRNLGLEGFSKATASWHNESKTPYIWDPKNRIFLGFENQKSLEAKMTYTVEKNLGGLAIWTLEMDDDVDSLLEAVTSAC